VQWYTNGPPSDTTATAPSFKPNWTVEDARWTAPWPIDVAMSAALAHTSPRFATESASHRFAAEDEFSNTTITAHFVNN